MSFLEITKIEKTYQHVKRYRQVLGILFEYGFGDLVDSLNVEKYLEIGLQIVSREPREKVKSLTTAERFRKALEDLGPGFIKLGQILSTRQDVLPADFVRELHHLQDKVPPFSMEKVKTVFEEDFESNIENMFSEFCETPIAAASIGQVHQARTKSGELVAVKVQRPEARQIIKIDLEIMFSLASLIEKHIDEVRPHRPSKIVTEFAESISRELDFNLEAASIERFASQFNHTETIYVPKVFHEQTSSRVLTMEFIEGIKISEKDKLIDDVRK